MAMVAVMAESAAAGAVGLAAASGFPGAESDYRAEAAWVTQVVAVAAPGVQWAALDRLAAGKAIRRDSKALSAGSRHRSFRKP